MAGNSGIGGNTTGKVLATDPRIRNGWLNKKLYDEREHNFWLPYMGFSDDAVIVMHNDHKKGEGHVLIYTFENILQGSVVVGGGQVHGTGENKRGLTMKVTYEEFDSEVFNGKRFDLQNIGIDHPNNASQHKQSIGMLADLYNRKLVPQIITDIMQSNLLIPGEGVVQAPTNLITYSSGTFGLTELLELADIAEQGHGFPGLPNKQIMPLRPHGDGASGHFYLYVDSKVARMLKSDADFKNLHMNAGVRGADNALLTGVIGTIENMVIVVLPSFIGRTTGEGSGFEYTPADSFTKAGMREYDTVNGVWTGQTNANGDGLDRTNQLMSRCILAGANGAMLCKGESPTYHLQEEDGNYKVASASKLHFVAGAKKIRFDVAADEDNDAAKLHGMDTMITVDIYHP